MAHHSDSQRARLEQQQLAFKALQKKRAAGNYGRNNSSDSFLFSGFTEWRMRRMASFAILIHAFAILFLVSWFFTIRSSEVATVAVDFNKAGMAKIDIPESNALYKFDVSQDFAGTAPLYSELEIEILDKNWDHVYSVYHDLWQESHPNGERGNSIYSDLEMNFEIVLPEAGEYYIRPISHNGNLGQVRAKVFKTFIGGIYMPYYAIFFGVLSLLLLLGSQKWGSPSMMYNMLPKLRSWKDNSLFKIAALFCIILFIGSWAAAIFHYGYAAGGDETILPTYFYRTNTVIYLG
jgi:hypothetical protein